MSLSEKQIQDLKDKKSSIEDLNDKYFYTQKDKINVKNILKLLNENICSFKKIVDKYKSIKDEYNDPCFYCLLRNKEFFKELIQNNKLNTDDLRYLLNRLDNDVELYNLSKNTSLLKHIVYNDLFKDIVDKFKNTKSRKFDSCLYELLKNKELFEELIKNNRLNEEDIRYLLNRIDKWYELNRLCEYNVSLIKEILNEFVLNKEDVDRLNAMIENNDQCKYYEIHTIFDLIEDKNKDNEEILKLNTLNKCVCSFDFDENQRIALAEILKDSEVAQNTLIQIIDNNLQDQYDFESLKSLLTKDDKKQKIKLNF